MNKIEQLPGITQAYFLSGQPFYYQTFPGIIYRFAPDTPKQTTGLLISEQIGNPKTVNNIHEQGFTMYVVNKAMNVKFKDCHSPEGRLTKAEMLKETAFIYRGTFTHLMDRQLQFEREGNVIINAKEDQRLTIQLIQDEKFAVKMKGYGIIPIYYHECELVKTV